MSESKGIIAKSESKGIIAMSESKGIIVSESKGIIVSESKGIIVSESKGGSNNHERQKSIALIGSHFRFKKRRYHVTLSGESIDPLFTQTNTSEQKCQISEFK